MLQQWPEVRLLLLLLAGVAAAAAAAVVGGGDDGVAVGRREDVEDRFKLYLLSSASCRSSLESLLAMDESNVSRDHSLEIDVFDLLQGKGQKIG